MKPRIYAIAAAMVFLVAARAPAQSEIAPRASASFIGGAASTGDVTGAVLGGSLLFDVNDRISVTKERYSFPWSVDPLHFHPQDAVVIYLRGGYIWPTTWFYGPDRVRRGDVRVLPGNVLHTTGNAGSDPLEFLLIIPA